MPIKLISIDLDGTLLDKSENVSKRDKKAIIDCLDKGIHILIVTGRPSIFAQSIIDKIDPRLGIIAFNGDIIEYQTIRKQVNIVDMDKLQPVCTALDMHTLYKSPKSICSDQRHPQFDYDHLGMMTHTNYQQVLEEGIVKIVGFTQEKSYEAAKKALAPFADDYSFAYYEGKGFEITAKGQNKGTALQTVQEILHISKEESMCFGDGMNDFEMFEACQYSVAMGNAVEALKKKAWRMTDTHQNSGVAQILEEIIN